MISVPAHAIDICKKGDPFTKPVTHILDKPVSDKYGGKAFFINLGPTGIRADIRPEYPKALKVKYVFQDKKSPARGLVKIGDMIIGANGKLFMKTHGFSKAAGNSRGWVGPPFELACAIEDSQGKDGKLRLTILVGGDKSKKKEVTIKLKPVGRFSKTYPWNCPRSDKLLKSLCDFMIKDLPTNRRKRAHITIRKLLALMAAGDKRVMPMAKKYAEELIKQPVDSTSLGMVTWEWGYKGIFLGEYYALTKDKKVLPAIKALNIAYEEGQYPHNGGYTHRPYPAIQKRIFEGGPKGYGAMASPGGLIMLAQSTFKASGLPYSRIAYESTHQAYLNSATSNGLIRYGFSNGYKTMFIRVAAKSPCRSKKGTGFICPTGMADIGKFKVEKWTNKAGPHIWKMELVPAAGPEHKAFFGSNRESLRVFDLGGDRRFVVKSTKAKEPTSPYKTGSSGDLNIAGEGLGALAHIVGNTRNKSWNYLGRHLGTCCANSAKYLWDGHANAAIHAFFGVLGAAKANKKDFRAFLDYTKTWIILSETHDGYGLIEQPFGVQGNGSCALESDRTVYTHVAILLLSIPKQLLLITGASAAGGESNSKPKSRLIDKPTGRKARKLSTEKKSLLEKSLLMALAELSSASQLKALPMSISKARSKIWLAKVESDGKLTFQAMQGNKQASFGLEELTVDDHALLSRLVARYRPTDKQAQATAGIYMEITGDTAVADEYYQKAGPEVKAQLDALFE